ncbi:MAG: toxin-antitoxin system YwqK family antitoxin [Bacteroidales bacterium]
MKTIQNIKSHLTVFIIIAMISGLLCAGCKRTVTDIYPSGKPKSAMQYIGKKLEGISVWYYENGNKQLEIYYKNGLTDGKLTRWSASGAKSLEEYYSKGLRNGKSSTWDEDGNSQEQKSFVNDTMDGKYILWYPTGMVKIEGYYFHGLYNGRWEYYNETGLKVGEGNFEKGSGKQQAFMRNGKLSHEVTYRNNLKDGPETWFTPEGKPEKQVLWKAGKFIEEKHL